METILKVKNLTKKYDSFTAVDNISFEVREGEIVGLVGPNGAGKTTTIHMLLSLLEPTAGSIEILGKDLRYNREEILSQINFAAPYTPLPHNLTPYEAFNVFSLLYGIKNGRREKIELLLKDFDLTRFRDRKSGGLSSGEQIRLSIAKAFLNDPKLLLLDEPTASLDPSIARKIRKDICRRMKELKGAILWTSHNMREIETVCDRIIFLLHGNIVTEGTSEDLKKTFKKSDLEEVFISLVEKSEKAHPKI